MLELSDLRQRYTQAITESEDIHVKGWGAGALARLDPFSADTSAVLSRLLDQDTNDWVRLNVAHARAAIDAAKAADSPAAENQRNEMLKRIGLFRRSLPAQR